jgi:hypothetical protein
MMRSQVKSALDGCIYLTESTLATVERLSALKSKAKSDVARQKLIAQSGIEIIIKCAGRIDSLYGPRGSRVREVIFEFGSSVENWARHKIHENKCHTQLQASISTKMESASMSR